MTDNGHENFGARMNRLRRERGIPLGGPGRKPIAEKYRKQIAAVERVFAGALPDLARTYVGELQVKAPETCPEHRRVLRCPAEGCGYPSQRTMFDHKACSYVIDRLLGRPVARSENNLTITLVRQVTEAFTESFIAVNDITDPAERQAAFARRLSAIAVQYDAHAGGW